MNRFLAGLAAWLLSASLALAAVPPIPPSGSLNPINAVPGLSNLNSINLIKVRRCLARVTQQIASCKILFDGDSVTRADGTAGTLFSQSFPSQLAQRLNALGIPARADSIWGLGGQSGMSVATFLAANPNVSLGAGWQNNTQGAFYSLGGVPFWNATDLTSLSWTPTQPFDRIEIGYWQSPGQSPFTVDIGGSVLATQTTAGTSAFPKLTVNCALGMNTINIKPTGTLGVGIVYIRAYQSNLPIVELWNTGSAGAKAADWNATGVPWSPGLAKAVVAPDLTFEAFGINDAQAISAAQFTTDLQSGITTDVAAGAPPAAVIVSVPPNTATVTAATWAQFQSAMRSLAITNNTALIDMTYRWGSYAQANTAPSDMADSVHPNAQGYEDWAAMMAAYFVTAPVGGNAGTWNLTALATDTNNHHAFNGRPPVVSACGTFTLDANANDSRGQVNVTAGTPTSCTITFALAYANWNHCTVAPEAAAASSGYSFTKTVLTVTGAAMAGKFDYSCEGS